MMYGYRFTKSEVEYLTRLLDAKKAELERSRNHYAPAREQRDTEDEIKFVKTFTELLRNGVA